MPGSELFMDAPRVSAGGYAAGDVGINLASARDRTAEGCVAPAQVFPAWATSQALLDVHAAHTESISGHINVIHATSAGIHGAVGFTTGADSTSAQTVAGVVIPGAA
jgi:hypothetical protein